MRKDERVWISILAVLWLLPGVHTANAQCPSSILSQPKGNALYLYFPTASDSTFPSYNGNIGTGSTSPLATFDVANLDSGIGTTADLRTRIFEIVQDDYCEFNVKVNQTTAAPAPPEARWLIVGLGTDQATSSSGGNLFGLAQAVDTNDADAQDQARVWADSFGAACGVTGGSLSGTNSTLQRWANAIGETAAHEAAHNYGAAHGHSAPRAGSAEDEQNSHIMATGNTGLTCDIRASRDRHFSDTEYEILGHNVGLNIKTLHNWDFINPNDTSANGMRIQLLSTASSLSIAWWYNGASSPWRDPTITNTGTTQSFQGTTYNVFNLDFTAAKSWSGGADGVVGAGVEFHTGASFTGSDAVIVTRVQLLSGGTALPLAPRLPGYDAGTADLSTGDFGLRFFNPDPGTGDLIITNLQVLRLPRMVDINAMVRGGELVDVRGHSVEPYSIRRVERVKLSELSSISIGRLSDKRTVDILYGPKDCPPGSVGSGTKKPGQSPTASPGDSSGKEEVEYCHRGNALSLFPSAYTYVIATVVQPNAKFWDKAQNKFVTGNLESRLFYQFGGIVPDFNRNGIDDLLDIRGGVSRDGNQNGIPDDVEPTVDKCPCGLERINLLLIISVVLLVFILVLVIVLVVRKR